MFEDRKAYVSIPRDSVRDIQASLAVFAAEIVEHKIDCPIEVAQGWLEVTNT